MRVAYVLKTFPRLSQTFIANEIRAHEAAGLPVEIYALRHPKAEDAHADVADLRARVSYLTPDANASCDASDLLCRALRRSLAGNAPVTHLHAHFGTSAAETARLAARATGLPYSFTAHARDIFHADVDTHALARRIAEARRVVTVSEFNLAHLRQRFGAPGERIVRIYNGIDLQRLAMAAHAGREPIVLAVGRLVEKKGFADLIDACAEMREHAPAWRCLIVGDGPLRAALQSRIDAAGLRPWVELLGAQPPARVVELMRRAAVLAAPCVVSPDGDRDGLPTVLLEAMALGCPVVATDVTGIPELVIDGRTGTLLPQHQPSALARTLKGLLADPARGRKLAEGARTWVERHFDITRNTARLRSLFADAAGARPGGASAALQA